MNSYLPRKVGKYPLWARIWWFITEPYTSNKYYFAESEIEHYERNVKAGNAAMVLMPLFPKDTEPTKKDYLEYKEEL